MVDCPMLEKCKRLGMSCEGRKFAECHFYKLLLKEVQILKLRELHKSWIKVEQKQLHSEIIENELREEALEHG
jgi:hypothetical protein